MARVISIEDLKGLFTKPYGADAPTKQKWAEFYNENVIFTDPTQETEGLDSYVKAQEKLVKRCDDVFLETHAISITGDCGFVEWTMGLKIRILKADEEIRTLDILLGKEMLYH